MPYLVDANRDPTRAAGDDRELGALAARPRGIRHAITLWRLWRRETVEPERFYDLLAAEAARDFERRYGPLAGRTILDLGCGPGFYTRALRSVGAQVIPVDNDPDELASAGGPPEGALVADAEDLPLEDESVDAVLEESGSATALVTRRFEPVV